MFWHHLKKEWEIIWKVCGLLRNFSKIFLISNCFCDLFLRIFCTIFYTIYVPPSQWRSHHRRRLPCRRRFNNRRQNMRRTHVRCRRAQHGGRLSTACSPRIAIELGDYAPAFRAPRPGFTPSYRTQRGGRWVHHGTPLQGCWDGESVWGRESVEWQSVGLGR